MLAQVLLGAVLALQDPFQDLDRKTDRPPEAAREKPASPGFFDDNFTFKKEIYSQLSYSTAEPRDGERLLDNVYSRQSLGAEVLKKFSTRTETLASVDVQVRLVRRDHFIETLNDMEGERREGWAFEYHNLYFDLYNVLDRCAGEDARGDLLGKVNFRAGHFYLPFGLNLQTDTHGTLLQLSNDRNFGFERDWYAGFYGALNDTFNYDVYYLLGSGYPLAFRGQRGMLGARLSLGGRFRNESGLEGGLSVLRGERLSKEAVERSETVALLAEDERIVKTLRVGVDGRYSFPALGGTIAVTLELSGGREEMDVVATQLYQIDYLADHRQWGLSVQYRRFWQQESRGALVKTGMAGMPGMSEPETWADSSIVAELAWYFRNDLTGSYLHSLRLNVERQFERQSGVHATVVTFQYYLYW